uniref:Uncharacterized protein n=1 Tax=Anopheles maculatus TaxID=74869 RepID=A0A182T8Q6_9DIPT
MSSTSPQSGGSPGGAAGTTTGTTAPPAVPTSTRKKTGKFLGSALNITNRYRANSSSLSKVSLAITNLKVIQCNPVLPPPISAMIASDIPPICKFLPSYRLGSRNPFNREACEAILRDSLDKSLQGVEYSSYFAPSLCQQICEDIKARVKELKFDRYFNFLPSPYGKSALVGVNFTIPAPYQHYTNPLGLQNLPVLRILNQSLLAPSLDRGFFFIPVPGCLLLLTTRNSFHAVDFEEKVPHQPYPVHFSTHLPMYRRMVRSALTLILTGRTRVSEKGSFRSKTATSDRTEWLDPVRLSTETCFSFSMYNIVRYRTQRPTRLLLRSVGFVHGKVE